MKVKMTIDEIIKYLPHAYPMLLVDKVLEIDGNSLIAVKNVTFNEMYFAGHFPNYPTVPGVLIVESLAQAAGILLFNHSDFQVSRSDIYFLATIENAKFKKPVRPGDQMKLCIKFVRARKTLYKFSCTAIVDENIVCTVDVVLAKGGKNES